MRSMNRWTVLEVAERLGVEREHARGLIHLLVGLDLAKDRGARPVEGGRGRGEKVYSFVDDYEKLLTARLKRARLT